MCGEQGFIAVHESVYETVHLVKFIGKGCSIFFSSAYVTLLSTTGYKVLKYSSRIHMVYLAAQQQNKLIQFPVCANVGVLFTLAKSRASNICWWKATNQNSRGNFQELDRIAALFPGKPELALFYFVLFLPYISFECLAAILPSDSARAPLRCLEFLAMAWYSVTGLREAHPNSIFSLAISVLEYYTANNVMSCFST